MRILVFCFLSIQSNLLFSQTQDYIWPTDASPYLSSTFAETRSAHFHSGLDIKTWGREGYRVFASKDGFVSRMAISSRGYGRVLYLTHSDGSVTVYAHLQRFIPELQNYIDSLRLIDHRFEIDIKLPDQKWPFKQGEVIGYTGSTGVGPPHLHFEIRDGDDVAVNALRTNLKVQDSIAPTISSILVIPASDSSTVNGSRFPQLFYPANQKNDTLTFGNLEARGLVKIAISEYDGADNVTNKYASFDYTLTHQSDTLFQSVHKSFHFDEAITMPLDRIAAFGASRRSFQTLFDNSITKVPFYKQKYGNGLIMPDSVFKEYLITVSDFYGNKTLATIGLKLEEEVKIASSNVLSEIENWYWKNDWLVQHNASVIDLKSNNFGVNWNRNSHQRLLYVDENKLLFTRIYPDQSTTIWSTDRSAKIHFPRQSTFDELSIALFTGSFDGFPALQIQPHTAALRGNIFIEYYVDEIDTLGANPQLFHYDRLGDRFSHVPSTLKGKTIHARTNQLGEFVVFSDANPPEISAVNIVQTDWGIWQVEVAVADEFSGIDFKNSEIKVNGVRGITEYDFEEEILIYLHPEFNPGELNRIEVIVSDNAGNSTFQTFNR
ncbi:MAG: M23 family metallopeptidase [bacterium]|nr:M23 family metallopeptidase [bacterium]